MLEFLCNKALVASMLQYKVACISNFLDLGLTNNFNKTSGLSAYVIFVTIGIHWDILGFPTCKYQSSKDLPLEKLGLNGRTAYLCPKLNVKWTFLLMRR